MTKLFPFCCSSCTRPELSMRLFVFDDAEPDIMHAWELPVPLLLVPLHPYRLPVNFAASHMLSRAISGPLGPCPKPSTGYLPRSA